MMTDMLNKTEMRPVIGLMSATVVTPFEFLRLPMVSVVGVWLYSEGLEWQVFVGALVVLGANWMNIRAEARSVQDTN